MVAEVNHHIGWLIDWLDATGQGENPPLRIDHMMEADFADPRAPIRFQRCFDLGIDACNAAILRNAHWSYVHFGGDVPPMLLDLANDPHETVSRAADPACQSTRMAMAEQLLRRMRARFDRRLTHFHFG